MPEEGDWIYLAKVMEFEGVKSMLLGLYAQTGSLEAMSQRLGYSKSAIRRRMEMYGIKRKGRGGAVSGKPRKLQHVPDEQLFTQHPKVLAELNNTHPSCVFSERKRRKVDAT